MDALTSLVLRRRRLVALVWLVLLAVGGFASANLSKHLPRPAATGGGAPVTAADGTAGPAASS